MISGRMQSAKGGARLPGRHFRHQGNGIFIADLT
jgi:hypothetical protein